jgi:opacity protein-like surface antigen
MKYLLIVLLLVPMLCNAQRKSFKSRKKKISVAGGTLFLSVGYNRDFYSKSKLSLAGEGYDFTLQGVKGKDQPAFSFSNINLSQYNFQVGYNFMNFFSISAGFDHMKYSIPNQSQLLLSGTINEDVDLVTNLSGSYLNQPFTMDSSTFHYSNFGLNNIYLKFARTDQWFRVGKNDEFALSSDVGIGFGGLMSSTDFTFAGKRNLRVASFSGFSAFGAAGVRLEFFRHLYIEPMVIGGFMNQMSVRTTENQPNATARQRMGFLQMQVNLGFFMYVRPTNSCDSCPTW